MAKERKPSRILWLLGLAVGFALFFVGSMLFAYRPDRPDATIEPGSSPGPAFVVQVIRPRLGLPLGGLLPPRFFGLEPHLGFSSSSPGAAAERAGPEQLTFRAEDWNVVLVTDAEGRVAPETEATFELMFEDRLRRVRCSCGDPANGGLNTTVLSSGEISGHFDIELERCVDAQTGKPLGWPPAPLVLHGSFDRLPLNAADER